MPLAERYFTYNYNNKEENIGFSRNYKNIAIYLVLVVIFIGIIMWGVKYYLDIDLLKQVEDFISKKIDSIIFQTMAIMGILGTVTGLLGSGAASLFYFIKKRWVKYKINKIAENYDSPYPEELLNPTNSRLVSIKKKPEIITAAFRKELLDELKEDKNTFHLIIIELDFVSFNRKIDERQSIFYQCLSRLVLPTYSKVGCGNVQFIVVSKRTRPFESLVSHLSNSQGDFNNYIVDVDKFDIDESKTFFQNYLKWDPNGKARTELKGLLKKICDYKDNKNQQPEPIINTILDEVVSDGKNSFASLPYDVEQRVKAFYEDFNDLDIADFENKLKEKIISNSKVKEVGRDLERIVSNNVDTKIKTYLRLWKKTNDGDRIERLALGIDKGDVLIAKNTICLLVTLDIEELSGLSAEELNEKKYWHPNEEHFKALQTDSNLFKNTGEKYPKLKDEVKRYISYDNMHYTYSINGLRICYEKTLGDFLEYNITCPDDARNLELIMHCFQSIQIAQSEEISNSNNSNWAHGIFRHNKTYKLIEEVNTLYCRGAEKEFDIETKSSIENALKLFSETILNALTIIPNRFNKHSQFCLLLTSKNTDNLSMFNDSINIVKEYITNNKDSFKLNEDKICRYFPRIFNDIKQSKDSIWKKLHQDTFREGVPDCLIELEELIFNTYTDLKKNNFEEKESLEIQAIPKVTDNNDCLSDYFKAMKEGYEKRYLVSPDVIKLNFMGEINRQRSNSQQIEFPQNIVTFNFYISSLRKVANSIAANIYNMSERYGIDTQESIESRYERAFRYIDQLLVIFEPNIEQLNDLDKSYLVTAQITTMLVIWDSHVRNSDNYESIEYVHAVNKKKMNNWLKEYLKFIKNNGDGIDIELRKVFESEYKDKFIFVEHKDFTSLLFSNENFEEELEQLFEKDVEAKELLRRIFGEKDAIKKALLTNKVIEPQLKNKFSELSNEIKEFVLIMQQKISVLCSGKATSYLGQAKYLKGNYYPFYCKYLKHLVSEKTDFSNHDMTKYHINAQAFAFSQRSIGLEIDQSEQIKENWANSLKDRFRTLRQYKHKEYWDNLLNKKEIDQDKHAKNVTNYNFTESKWQETLEIFKTDKFSSVTETTQSILRLLASLNPENLDKDFSSGFYFIAEITGESGKDFTLKMLGQDLSEISNPKEILLRNEYAPTDIHNEQKNKSVMPIENEDTIVEEYNNLNIQFENHFEANKNKSYIGKAILVTTMKDDNNTIYVTARGPDFIGPILQLFMPFIDDDNWAKATPQRSSTKSTNSTNKRKNKYEWSGDYWLGASNSCVALKLPSELKSIYLSGNGLWQKILVEIMMLRRFVIFENDKDVGIMIKHFINDMYSDLRIMYSRDERTVTCFTPDPTNMDDRRIRTFHSMFTKVFSDDLIIDQWLQETEVEIKLRDLQEKWSKQSLRPIANLNKVDIKFLAEKAYSNRHELFEFWAKEQNEFDKFEEFTEKQRKEILDIFLDEYE